MRLVMTTAMSVCLLAGCGGGEPAAPAAPAEPAPAAAPDGARTGTMTVTCGGETFRVAFLDTHATIVDADGAQIAELPVLPADPASEPGVTVYSDGLQQFSKSGGGDTPAVIRYARGRMAWQDCAVAAG